MRRFVLLLVLLSCFSFLDASTIYASRKSFGFVSDDISFSMDYGHLSLSYEGFSSGDIGNRGLLRTISNLHSYSDFVPCVDKFNKKEQKRGFILEYDVLKLFYLRNVVGFECSIGPFDLFYIFKARGNEDSQCFIDFKNSIGKDVMYLGGRYDIGIFSISGITSFDDNGNFFSFLGAGCECSGAFLDVRLGNVFPVFKRKNHEVFSISLGFERECASMSWKVALGSEPIYTNTYMARRSVKSISVGIGSARLECKSEVMFMSDGRCEESDRIAFVHDFLSIYYDSSSGLRHRLSFDYASLSLEAGSIGVAFDFPFSTKLWKVELELRALHGFDVRLSTEFP